MLRITTIAGWAMATPPTDVDRAEDRTTSHLVHTIATLDACPPCDVVIDCTLAESWDVVKEPPIYASTVLLCQRLVWLGEVLLAETIEIP